MRHSIATLCCCSASLVLAACAAAPRAPAARLAEAGIGATGTFAAEVRTAASQLAYVDAIDAFAMTWEYCQNRNIPCTAQVPAQDVANARRQLSETISARAQALDALGAAYASLGQEAAADGGADLAGAVDNLVSGVNNYAGAVSGLTGTPVATLVTPPIAAALRGIAAEIGEQRQRRRIIAGSRAIRTAAEALRNALAAEAGYFDTIADYLVTQRTTARLALMQAGLVSRSAPFTALARNLEVTPTGSAESVISASVPVQTALEATVRAQSQAEVVAVQQRYRTSVEALGALIAAHRQLETEQAVSLGDLERVLSRLQAVLDAATPAPAAAGQQP